MDLRIIPSIEEDILEQLFGSMDYCVCERCRSVLGTAAYLMISLILFNLNLMQ